MIPSSFRIVFLIVIVIHLYITWMVFKSAEDSSMNPFFWAALYFFTIPIGGIMFIIARAAGGMSGTNMAAGKIGRKRLVDSRDSGFDPKSIEDMLPRPSIAFHDETLKEYFFFEEWDKAVNHIDEMKELAIEDGNTGLAADYGKLVLWINEKVNPFSRGR